MGKRFTETGKWEKAWFRKLPPRMKCAWEFLRDNCDLAGIWEIDIDSLNWHVNETAAPIKLEELSEAFDVRILPGSKLYLPTFVPFQYYGKDPQDQGLNPKNKVHLSVIRRLRQFGLPYQLKEGCEDVVPSPSDAPSEDLQCSIDSLFEGLPSPQGKGKGEGERKREGKNSEGGAGETKSVVILTSKPTGREWLESQAKHEAEVRKNPADPELVRKCVALVTGRGGEGPPPLGAA